MTTATEWTYTTQGKARFGGFEAEMLTEGHGELIFVRAIAWKGKQPRIVLARKTPGYQDWAKLMEEYNATVTFEGNEEFAQNLVDQWLTH